MLVKRGQVSIFVIIAIVIVAAVIGYFLLKGKISFGKAPANLQEVENYFLSCAQDEAEIGTRILGEKAGYIYTPEFSAGSEFMPFSNKLNFLGSDIPYWYYVSANNVIKEQMPTKSEMERQLEKYLNENIECDFSEFEEKGFVVDISEIKSDVKISENDIKVSINADLDASFEDESYRFTKHEADLKSSLGSFYDEAAKIYNYEKQNSFLENYAVDVLRMYAPVDGVELSCSPKIWMKNEVDSELKKALEANMQAISFSNGQGYFKQSLVIKKSTRILYDGKWPTRIEIWDSNNGVMMAEPVGNQPGLGALGFCYIPYHFVYDVVFPALIQVYDSNYLFQFPVAVIIDKNKAREAVISNNILDTEPELCKYANTEVSVYTYNTNLEPVEADISFECLGQKCDIGKTKTENNDALLTANFPQCLNGFILASSGNYSDKKYMFSSNKEDTLNIILDRLYELDLQLKINSQETSDNAIITFYSENNIQTVAWPEQKKIKLSEGQYNISIYAYREGKITIPGMKKEFCNEVPVEGLGGVFGITEEKCFDVDIPSQELTNVISAGGKGEDYFIESQLENAKKAIISISSIPTPSSLEQLQDSYNILEVKPVDVEFE